MYSGKTDKLISYAEEAKTREEIVLAMKPRVDTRWGEERITSRTGRSISAITFSDAIDMQARVFKHLDSIPPSSRRPVNIVIDEAQFVPGISGAIRLFARMGFHVYIAGLSGDRDCKPWTSISDLIPICDSIEFLHARCKFCGGEASFTLMQRIALEKQKAGQIEIDDGKNYAPACRKCWEEKNN